VKDSFGTPAEVIGSILKYFIPGMDKLLSKDKKEKKVSRDEAIELLRKYYGHTTWQPTGSTGRGLEEGLWGVGKPIEERKNVKPPSIEDIELFRRPPEEQKRYDSYDRFYKELSDRGLL